MKRGRCGCNCHDAETRAAMNIKEHADCDECWGALYREAEDLHVTELKQCEARIAVLEKALHMARDECRDIRVMRIIDEALEAK